MTNASNQTPHALPSPVSTLGVDGGKVHVDCWQCGGTGLLAGCFEDCCSGADCDPEDPENCCSPSRCDICKGKGGYEVPANSDAARDAIG